MSPSGGGISAVIFDLDGTLLDTLADLAACMNSVLAAHGMPTHPPDAYRYFVGEGMEVLVRRTLPQDRRDAAQVAACFADVRGEYGRRWAETSRPYQGVAEMLDQLVARGLTLSVLSNKLDEFTVQVVSQLLPQWQFAQVRGMRSDTPAKPDPAGALAIAADTGVAAQQTLYVGDTATDMKTGRAAGMRTIGVTWGFRDAEELLASGAHELIDRPAQLLELI